MADPTEEEIRAAEIENAKPVKQKAKEKLEAELKLAQSSASKRNGFVVNGIMVKGGSLEDIISSINGELAKMRRGSGAC